MDKIVAIVNSQGVLLRKNQKKKAKFYLLELAFVNVLSSEVFLFYVKCPYSYTYIKNNCDRGLWSKSISAYICDTTIPYRVYSYKSVINILRSEYKRLNEIVPGCIFAHKGISYQTQILKDARIPGFNLETIGCPKPRSTSQFICHYHPQTRMDRCALLKIFSFMKWLLDHFFLRRSFIR